MYNPCKTHINPSLSSLKTAPVPDLPPDPLSQRLRAPLQRRVAAAELGSGLVWWLPSGLTKNYGKSPCLRGKSTISMAMVSIAMLNYQRVRLANWLVNTGIYWLIAFAIHKFDQMVVQHQLLGWLFPPYIWTLPGSLLCLWLKLQ